MNYLLIFALMLLLGAWIRIHAKRTKEKDELQKETQEIVLDRFRSSVVPVRRNGKKTRIVEKTDDFPVENNRARMRAYSFHQKD